MSLLKLKLSELHFCLTYIWAQRNLIFTTAAVFYLLPHLQPPRDAILIMSCVNSSWQKSWSPFYRRYDITVTHISWIPSKNYFFHVMPTRETEQAEGVPGGPYSSLAEDSISLCVGCRGWRCGVTGWGVVTTYPWWSQGEAWWSLLLFGDLLMRFAKCKACVVDPDSTHSQLEENHHMGIG